ncbi:MAG: hypothetical protein IRY85_19540 [Micromonosporaceae bacterium]|nr:hypothetical protein [Micromonosporaceae bacterium]
MDADRTRSAEQAPPASHDQAPSDERIHEQQRHEEAEEIAVEGDDLSEIFESVLGRERPHVGEPPPEGAPWPPPLGRRADQAEADHPTPAERGGQTDRTDGGADENRVS